MASKDKVPEKVQEAIFNKLLSRPEDMECADCRNKSPTWVSLDFGVFVCIRCSGVHRQLGPHITRVRSTRLDGWTKDNIDIMAAIGNKIANDFYEYRMPNGYRKPTANSSPEECRRFVDEKYIRKAFAPSGHPEPVKEYLSCKSKGNDPEFGYSKGHQQQNNDKGDTKILRKKSMSLDRFDNQKKIQQQQQQQQQYQQQQQHQQHQHQQQQQNSNNQDLLSGDVDLLGGGSHDDFGDFKQAQSASPVKRQDPQFKKVHSENEANAQNQWNWNFDGSQNQNQNQNQGQNQNQNQANNNNSFPNNSSPQGQVQGQTQGQNTQQNKVDFMKLYNQPQMQMQGHQNHFMQMGMQQGGWNSHHNNQWHSAGPSYGMMGQQQNQYPQNTFQQQTFQQNNQGFGGGFNTGMNNMGYGMGGMQNMGYGQPQGQFNNNAYPNNNFAQMSNGNNRFF